jgi:sulfoxide reductase heme-binding subunit YedZ
VDGVTPDLFFWILARVSGLASFAALAIALLTGIALRTGVLDWLGSNRALRSLHEYTTVLWIPLGGLHVLMLLLDQTARVRPVDVLVPFGVPYGTLGIGLGTLTFDILVVVTITAWLRRRIGQQLWQWLHRLSYLAFGLLFLHAVLGGTDFNDPAVAVIAWSTAGALLLLAGARVIWGRLPA